MHPELERRVCYLEGLTKLHQSVLSDMLMADGGKLFGLDILASAAAKRSMSLCAAFATLVRTKNYVSAASLVRLQLDSCLRFFAAFIVSDPHGLAEEVLKGKPIRKLKDMDGNLMTDRYLVDTLGRKYSWIPRVYEATSGFIHLSDRHIFSVFQDWDETGKVSLRVSAADDGIPDELWIELTDGFLASTDALFEYLKGWVHTKRNPHLAEAARIERAKRTLKPTWPPSNGHPA